MNLAATTAKNLLTAKEIFEQYNVEISPQRLGAFRRQQRVNAGPPFRYSLSFPPPVLTPEEEAEALAQAEYDDDMGILGRDEDEEGCVRLAAQDLDGAKAEAEHLWQTEPHEGALGYAIYSRDWGCRHVYRIDNVVILTDVRTR
jgi:hypothetical protein